MICYISRNNLIISTPALQNDKSYTHYCQVSSFLSTILEFTRVFDVKIRINKQLPRKFNFFLLPLYVYASTCVRVSIALRDVEV